MNKLLIYDIDSQCFTKQVSINPNIPNMRYLYIDDQGTCCFQICRSAEMVPYPPSKQQKIIQEQKFQVFSFYIETMGRIQIQEYLVKQLAKVDPLTGSNYLVQLVGQKQILMSNKCIKNTTWNFLKKSFIIPFFDEEHVQQGCQCILQHDKDRKTILNLID